MFRSENLDMGKFTSVNCVVYVEGLKGQHRAGVFFEAYQGGVHVRVMSRQHNMQALLELRQRAMACATAKLGRVPKTIEDVRQLCGGR